MAYFPPIWALTADLGSDFSFKEADTERVSISLGLLKMIIRAGLKGASLDEQSYIEANPDLKAAFEAGQISSVFDHWVEAGYFEDRFAATTPFDEAYYLDTYRDVSLSVQQGHIKDAKEHYRTAGEREWRIPNAAVEPEIRAWRTALLSQIAPMKQPE